MSGVTVELKGVRSTYETLKDMEFKIVRKILQSAVRAGMAEIRTTARKLAPVETGLLRKQLTSSAKTDRVTGTVVGTLKPKRTKAARAKGKAHSGRYLHLVVGGTKEHGISAARFKGQYYSRVQHPGAKPQPFMDQAVSISYRAALISFNAKLDERVLKEAAKLRAKQALTLK